MFEPVARYVIAVLSVADEAATLVEYGILMGLVGVVVFLLVLILLGGGVAGFS
jgi:Flp pilus assembly pilin Flp